MNAKVTNYTRAELNGLHMATFRQLSQQYGKGRCVGLGSWEVRVSNSSCSLVTKYQTKNEDGTWSGINEYTQAL